MQHRKLALSAMVVILTAPMGVAAQTKPAASPPSAMTAEGDIIVTARRRQETAQSVPSTINVLTGVTLARSGLTNAFEIQSRTPSLAIAISDREVNVSIRGIANNIRSIGADPSNAASLNGVYLPRAGMVLGQLYDVARVEVLKGPQGTLYGRNATGGAINVISAEPTKDLSVDGYAGIGSYHLRRGEGAISFGNDIVAVRLAGMYVKDDGYTKNLLNGTRFDDTNYSGFRGTIRLTPTDTLKAVAFWQHSDDKGGLGYGLSLDPSLGGAGSYAALPASFQRTGPRDIRIDYPQFSRRKGDVAGLTIDWSTGGIGLRSITGFTHYVDRDSQDTDGTGLPIEQQITSQHYKSYSQEFQAFSKNPGKIDWLLGVFLYGDSGREFLDYSFNLAAIPAINYQPAALLNTTAKSRSEAVYGQVIYHLTDTVSLIAGGRYSHDWKRGERVPATTFALVIPQLDARTTGDRFTPSIQAQWKPDANIMLYASVAEGYKNGGINAQDTIGRPTFGPEHVWAYEAGVKSQWLDRRVTFNLAAFYMDYRDIQFRTAILQPGTIVVAVTNDAKARIKGLEAYLDAQLGAGFSGDFSGSYLDTDVRNFISATSGRAISGIPLPLAPKWSGTFGLNYSGSLGAAGSVTARIEYNYRSRITFPFTYDATFNTDGAVGLVNGTLRWTEPKGRFYIEAIGRNLTNALYRVNRGDLLPTGVFEAFGAPRTIEGRIGFKF